MAYPRQDAASMPNIGGSAPTDSRRAGAAEDTMRRAASEGHSHRRRFKPPSLQESSAEAIIQALAPACAEVVFNGLQRERISTAADVINLDKDDLRELGLTMSERNKVLSWARQETMDRGSPRGHDNSRGRSGSYSSDTFCLEPLELAEDMEVKGESIATPLASRAHSSGTPSGGLVRSISLSRGARRCPSSTSSLSEDFDSSVLERLDEVEQQGDFWCKLVSQKDVAQAAEKLQKDVAQAAEKLRRERDQAADLYDLRENLLEKLFDLNPERLKEVYESIDKDSDGRILKDELKEGLTRCELHGFDGALEALLQKVSTHDNGSLELAEFMSVLTRLKLAQLLTAPGNPHLNLSDRLTVIDYHVNQARNLHTEKLLDFFFGHRSKDLPMRWVHMRGFDLTILLALTIKYQLHPLAVEDVIDRSPTRVDRYSSHYFAAVEHMCLNSSGNGEEPISVLARHVTIFCAGPPHHDTVITIAQPDTNVQDSTEDVNPQPFKEDAWVSRLQRRLRAVRSRSRERKSDFLMYEIIDVCTDDLVRVAKAYTARLNYLERCLSGRAEAHQLTTDQRKLNWYNEVNLVKLELAMLLRRLRGMQRILRRLHDDADFSQVPSGYLQDVADHITESYEDGGHLVEKCTGLIAAYEHKMDREQDKIHQASSQKQAEMDERMNRMLFVLTVLTTIFTPLTFVAGVYGMNFQGPDGRPSIPELLWPDGYYYFWTFTVCYLSVASVCGVLLWRRVIGKRIARDASTHGSISPHRHHRPMSDFSAV